MTSVTMKDFQQTVAAAATVSELEPVVVVEDGEPRKVLVDIAEYRRMGGVAAGQRGEIGSDGLDLASALAMPEDEYFEWEPEPLQLAFRPVDFD